MRLGVVSDIHANLHALDAVLEALRRERVDGILCLGDVVGYGALPNECVDRLREVEAATVAGNHDLVASGRQGVERCEALALETLRWTIRVLRDDARTYLADLPLHVEPSDAVVAVHGSLHDPWRYVARSAGAARELATLARERPDARLLLLGHTHVAQAFGGLAGARDASGDVVLDPAEPWLLNPGAVGQSRDEQVVARALVVDLGARTARFLSVPYDVDAARAALVRAGLPPAGVHLPPDPAPTRRRGRLARVRRGR